MSFIIEINGNEITSIEDLKANFDIDALLTHRANFDDWLFGWDYEDEAAQVRELSPDLSDDEWLEKVSNILGVSSATLADAKNKRDAERKKAEEAAAAMADAEEKKKQRQNDREKSIDFLMPIEYVSSIEEYRGAAVSGRIERGYIEVKNEVEIIGFHDTVRATVCGIKNKSRGRFDLFPKEVNQAQSGDYVTCLLAGVDSEYVECGQVLAKPGSITSHTKFIANLSVLSKEEGGRHTPFFNNYRPQFYFHTTDVTGTITLQEGTELVMPGDNVTLTIELAAPIAMKKGLNFYMREGGRKVASGTVVEIIK